MKHLLFVLLFPAVLFAQNPDDYRWDNRFGAPGILPIQYYSGSQPTPVEVLAPDGDVVYVGGKFTSAGRNIAAWDTRTRSWSELGIGVNGTVRAMAVHGDTVYVAGDFTEAGGISVQGIAAWNKRTGTWSALDKGVRGVIKTLTIYKGELYAGGAFSNAGNVAANNVARWDGSVWHSLGNGIANGVVGGYVYTLLEYSGELWAGGDFLAAGANASANKLARWDGTSWKPTTGVLFGTNKIAMKMVTSNGNLYISGYWDSLSIGGVPQKVLGLAMYDGVNWSTIVQSFGLNSYVTPLIFATGDDLFIASGQIQEVNGILAKGVARFNVPTGRWSALGGGVSNGQYSSSISGICVAGGKVFVSGQYTEAGGQFVNNIAAFDLATQQWEPLGSGKTLGLLGQFRLSTDEAFRFIEDNQNITVFGNFDYAANARVNGIATWDGSTWLPVGSGFIDGLMMRKNGSYGSLTFLSSIIRNGQTMIIGGDFAGISGKSASCLAILENGVYKEYAGGVTGAFTVQGNSSPGTLNVSAMSQDGNNLYVGGTFKQAGTFQAGNIARWDGQTWDNMGGGVSYSTTNYYPAKVNTIVRSPQGDIYAGGLFSAAGSVPVAGLARWDGQRWNNVGTDTLGGQFSGINAIAFAGNDMYIGGSFLQRGGKFVRSIARWDGQQWYDLGGGLGASSGGYSIVYSLVVKGDNLYVGGSFTTAGDIPAQNIAIWNMRTQTWSALGSGVYLRELNGGGAVRSIAFRGDTVFLTGIFDAAGDKPSFNIAAWLPTGPSSVEQLSTEAPEALELIFSPNPASTNGTFDFHLEKSGTIRLVLADALGREVMTVAEGAFTTGSYRVAADVSLLSTGVYYARLYTPHGTAVQAAVIQR